MRRALAIAAALAAAPRGIAAQPEGRPMVEWVVPATPAHRPQTPEEAEEGRRSGRKLPPPEVLQPPLDPALPSYAPRGEKLTGTFKGAASDVLAVLAQKWIDRFRKFHPGVDLSISPPYAGSLGAAELAKGTVDFVFVSRELKPEDIRDFKAKFGYDPASIPICGGSYRHFGALDAVAFFVNTENPIEELTFEQIDAIYSTTRHRGKNVDKAPGRPLAPALREFLRFLLSREGQQVVLEQAIYLPLREGQARSSRAQL